MPFSKIHAVRMSAAVVRQIEKLILQGVLRPGDRLPSERELSELLDVSRPTLREALAELEERKLVTARPGGGTFVADALGSAFSPQLIELLATHESALDDYVAFRRDMEGLAAERAAVVATATDLEAIRAACARMEAAKGIEEASRHDADFHMAIGEATHNVVMIHMMRALYELLVRGIFRNRAALYDRPEGLEVVIAQHREMVAALETREPARARAVAEAHLDYVSTVLDATRCANAREETAALRRSRDARPPKRRRKGASD